MARLFNRLSDYTLADKTALKQWGQSIVEQLEEEVERQDQSIADIAEILNIDILDPSEKASLILEVQQIVDEKAGINAQATSLSITTENTSYNSAYTTLINYLNGLSPAYTDTTQSTTISRTTFDNNFEAFYSARQALLNKMADVASAQSVVINPFADVVIYASSTGTVKTGELPRNVSLTASKGNTTVTTSGTWARTVTTGVTCTIGASTGVLNITALTAAEVSVPVTFTYSGVTRYATVHIIRQDDPPTNSGGSGSTGGTSSSTTTLGNTTGTAYDTTNAVSATLTVTTGSTGQIACTAPITFKRTGTTYGENGAYGKWQWRVPAGAWADIAAEVQESITSAGADTDPWGDGGDPVYTITAGDLSVSQTKTGLAASTTYEVRFLWRRRDVSGTAENIYRSNGTLEAVAS